MGCAIKGNLWISRLVCPAELAIRWAVTCYGPLLSFTVFYLAETCYGPLLAVTFYDPLLSFTWLRPAMVLYWL